MTVDHNTKKFKMINPENNMLIQQIELVKLYSLSKFYNSNGDYANVGGDFIGRDLVQEEIIPLEQK